MRSATNILMIGGAKRVSFALQLKAAGRRLGTDVNIFSSELNPQVPIVVVGTVVEGVRWNSPGIYDNLSEAIRAHGIDIVLPFIDGAIGVCSRLKELHPEVFIPVSPSEIADAMYDKAESAALFKKSGFPIPATYTPATCKYPAILKPRKGSASKGIKIAYNREELEENANIEDYLIQQYIADREEYTVDCYVSPISRKILCAVPRLRISTAGGEVDRTETKRIPELIEISEKILTTLDFQGPVTLQFIHDMKTGKYLLMEINPRLGGGVVCSVNAGADIAEMILRESIGEEALPVNDWKQNALMTRYFSEVMFYEDEK